MALRLTLDIFSGRPNPVVVIDGPEEKELLERLGVGRKKSKATGERLAGPPAVLRYRGVVIEPLRPSAMPGKPARPAAGSASTPFRLAGGSVHLSSRVFEPLDPRVE